MIRTTERFDETGGYGISLRNNNQIFEKLYATYGGNYARGQQKYSNGKHSIRFQLEPILDNKEANIILVGIISSNVIATDQYFNQTPSLYAWETSSHEWEDETTIVQNGIHQKVSKDKWSGAETGDILELTIDCDQQSISIQNETRKGSNSMKVDLKNSPLPWKFITIFSMYSDRVRLL
ncbi:hypothetical protein I4U23_004923 [Adineta vaga]|nr:hypothetical protein I4U23_004923 [Adineta vaga]